MRDGVRIAPGNSGLRPGGHGSSGRSVMGTSGSRIKREYAEAMGAAAEVPRGREALTVEAGRV